MRSTYDINIKSRDGKYIVTIDGEELHGVRSADVRYEAACVPTVELELIPTRTDIDALAQLDVALDITDVREAINCLHLEMRLNDEFRKAAIASAASALTEHGISKESATEIAEAVVERIFEGNDL